jgi:hypothetical protein
MEDQIVETLYQRIAAMAADNDALLVSTFPRDLQSVTAAWLSGLMQQKVLSFETKKLEMGALSDLGVVTMVYNENPDGKPMSIVMKFAKGVDSSRAGAVAADSYVKEINFFKHHSGKVPLKTPALFRVFEDPMAPAEFFCICMEDLNSKWAVMDQITGLTVEDCMGIASPIAKLHAQYWGDPCLQQQWLNTHPTLCIPWYDIWCDSFRSNSHSIHDSWLAACRKKHAAEPSTFFDPDELVGRKGVQDILRIVLDVDKFQRFTDNTRAVLTGE